MEQVVVGQAEATSTGAKTVRIVEIHRQEVNHSLKFNTEDEETLLSLLLT